MGNYTSKWIGFTSFVKETIVSLPPNSFFYGLSSVLVSIFVWKLIRNRSLYWRILKTLPRDIKCLPQLIRLKRDLRRAQANNATLFGAFDKTVKSQGNKVMLYFEDQQMTFKEVQILSYKVASYFYSKGLRKGDAVAIFMENCAEYVPLFLGLSRIGCVSALINYNLRLKPLKHCIEAVSCKAIIFSPSLADALKELLEEEGELSGSLEFYYMSQTTDQSIEAEIAVPSCRGLQSILHEVSPSPPQGMKEDIGFGDRILFIFTSGTTGLPKAAPIKHSRLFLMGGSCYYIAKMRPSDIIYTALPLYHGSGTMLGSCVTVIYGPGQIIRKKFSASGFWTDCIRHKATVGQYIGEVCRYLLAQGPTKYDKAHCVRAMYGNGLRSEIWVDFVKRFGIKHIGEFYGSTEGNCGMANLDNQPGAVGFMPLWAPKALPITLIHTDEDTGQPIRDPKTGFVMKCKVNEAGELIGRIKRNNPLSDFEGYADKSSTDGKILKNAFRNGDCWFRSGDVLVRDELGYFYFRDRKGDTFRWKGENCSTAEVESIMSSITGLRGTVVFGVEVPHADGRAGMAVISDPEGSLDLNQLAEGVSKSLPSYARPVFVRIISTEIDMTGTYKLKKNTYQKEAFDMRQINDKMYILIRGKYVEFTEQQFEEIQNGTMRL